MMWMRYCCAAMARYSTLRCDIHTDKRECPDVLVIWSNRGKPGFPIKDGGTAVVAIRFCPWCGAAIP
jgi:hypothetical protein